MTCAKLGKLIESLKRQDNTSQNIFNQIKLILVNLSEKTPCYNR